MGNRVVKVVKPKNNGLLSYQKDWKYTYYTRDDQGNVMAVYKRDELEALNQYNDDYYDRFKLAEHHIYGSDRMGIENSTNEVLSEVTMTLQSWNADKIYNANYSNLTTLSKDTNYFNQEVGDKTYECKNHLGNVLTTVSDRKLIKPYVNGNFDGFESDVISWSLLYPFGMEIGSLSNNSESSRHGFNGMEKDNEIKGNGNSINYKARFQDPRLGRFFSVDPLTSQFSYYSPYQFAGNIPTMAIDLDGNEEYIIHKFWSKTKTGYNLDIKVTYNREIKRRANYGFHKNRKADLYLNNKYIKSEINKFEEGTWESKHVESYTDMTYKTTKDAIDQTNGTQKTLKESIEESNGSGLRNGYSARYRRANYLIKY
jgi:RHS repeat-associated protein